MDRYFLLLFLLISSTTTLALGRTISYEEMRNDHFGSIRSIKECGTYKNSEELGEYRVIHSYIYGGDMIYVDRVAMKDPNLKVIRGYSFKEINNDHFELHIGTISCELEDDENLLLNIEVTGSGHEEERAYDILIKLNAIKGTYTYKSFNKSVQSTPAAKSD